MRWRSLLLIGAILVVSFAACKGNDDNNSTCPSTPALEENQSLWVAPLGIDFGLSTGFVTPVGTSQQGSVQLCNYGTKNLTFSGGTLSADATFKFNGINDANQTPVTSLAPNKTAFASVYFTPTEGKLYPTGSLVIHSDADKSNATDPKNAAIQVIGCSYAPLADGGEPYDLKYCYPDAGY